MRPPQRIRLSAETWFRWALVAFLILNGCSKTTEPEIEESSTTTVDGRVVEADDAHRGVPGASVRAVGKPPVATTDSPAHFSLPVHSVTAAASVSAKVTSPNGDARVIVTGNVDRP